MSNTWKQKYDRMFAKARRKRQELEERIAELEAELAQFREYGVAYQHEDTGQQGVVDQWQVDNGFFENNPRLERIGKVYVVAQND